MTTLDNCSAESSHLCGSRRLTWLLLVVMAFCPCLMAGCGDDPAPRRRAKVVKKKPKKKLTHTPRPGDKPFYQPKNKLRENRAALVEGDGRTLGDLLNGEDDEDVEGNPSEPKKGENEPGRNETSPDEADSGKKETSSGLDDAKLEQAGIRKISGTHLTLYTDVVSAAAVDELPRVFDLAVPKWCEYFGIDLETVARWHVVGCLVKDKDLFRSSGLLPADLPPFTFGYAKRDRFWLYEVNDSSDYYRRHLMLHEGTHAIMFAMLKGAGAPWYKEGIAELMATHYWNDEEEADEDKLTLRYFPDDVEDFPKLGRIKIIQDSVAAGRRLKTSDVMNFPAQAFLKNNAYAWAWALSAFLDGSSRYQQAFGDLRGSVQQGDAIFNAKTRHFFEGKWMFMLDEWQIYLTEMEHHYDLEAMAIDFSTPLQIKGDRAVVDVESTAGWQNTGLRLNSGQTYSLTASGRVQLAEEPEVWWSEPNGISIRYHLGMPRGLLLAVIRPEREAFDRESIFLRPIGIGPGKDLTIKKSGTLYLRINDSPGELLDNDGTYQVIVQRKTETP